MFISIFSSCIWNYMQEHDMTRNGVLKWARTKGLDAIDIYAGEFGGEYTPAVLKNALKQSGMKVGSVYDFCSLAAADNEMFERGIEHAKCTARLVADLGATQFMIVPALAAKISVVDDINDVEDKPRAAARIAEGLRIVAPLVRVEGVQLSIENFSQKITPFSTADEIEYLLSISDDISYTLDTGNFRCRCGYVLEAYERLKSRVTHVHVKDWNIFIDGNELYADDGTPLNYAITGRGIIPIGETLRRLKRDGYDGGLCLELWMNRIGERIEDHIKGITDNW